MWEVSYDKMKTWNPCYNPPERVWRMYSKRAKRGETAIVIAGSKYYYRYLFCV
jgi:hypothetical protein